MNIDLLLRHTATLITTPRDVAKLRQMILTLAVQGKLVPQEAVWNKYTLKNLTTKIGSGSTPEGGKNSYVNAGIPLIRSMNVHTGKFIFDGLAYLSHEQANKLNNVTTMQHDVLLNITGASIGRVSVIPDILVGARVNQHVCIIRPKSDIVPKYLEIVLASPQFQSTIFDIQVGATREALTKSMIESFEIPLPPLAEQRRIVARVDELMAICDTLEAQLQARAHMQARVVQAALARVQADPSPASIATLLDPKIGASPADLRQTILTLAVQGKLVPQESGDEPVPLESHIQGDYELPFNWKWTTLEQLGDTRPKNQLDDNLLVSFVPMALIPDEYGRQVKHEVRLWKEIKKGYTHFQNNDVVLAKISPCFENGKAAVMRNLTNGFGAGSTELFVFRVISDLITPQYVLITLKSPFFMNIGETKMTGTAGQKRLPHNFFAYHPIPLPPLAEQRRIVARVDELMALVDRLEAQQAQASALGAQVLDALVGGG
jgi:type I restriction enzyme, S subunit